MAGGLSESADGNDMLHCPPVGLYSNRNGLARLPSTLTAVCQAPPLVRFTQADTVNPTSVRSTEPDVVAYPLVPLNDTALPGRPGVHDAFVSVNGWLPPESAAVAPAPSPNAHQPTGGVPLLTKNRYAVMSDRLPARSTLRT